MKNKTIYLTLIIEGLASLGCKNQSITGSSEKLIDKYKGKQGIVVVLISVYYYLVMDIEDDCIIM